MQLIDTHTHIYLPEFDSDRDEAVSRAIKNGVVRLLMPNIDLESVDKMISAENRYPGTCFSMVGLHPTSVRKDFRNQLDKLESLIPVHKFIAIGETGIDLYWDRTFLKEQLASFRKHLELASRSGLPVVIHSRDSFPEVFSILEEFDGVKLNGVFHAFSGDLNDAERAIRMGFFLGIGGVVTFKNSGLDKIVEHVGPSNIVLETDSPYLAPVPHRGKRNESSYIGLVNRKLAGIFGMEEAEIAEITSGNATKLFNL
jgi:TatD DNase family protein